MGIAERKSRQKQALRERILDAARRIVMGEGFAALSMRKIADAIEYSPATLYLHFASRDEIAHALCAEGYAQLLQTFVPLAGIVDPAERLKALGRAYVAFGVTHRETYRLIFMEDQSYMGAALAGAGASVAGKANALADDKLALSATDPMTSATPPAIEVNDDAATTAAADDPGAAALHLMIAALDALKAAGRLPASTDTAVWAEAFWATLHGIVALNLTCPVFPTASLDTVVDVALDAWLGASQAVPHTAPPAARRASPSRRVASTAGAEKKQSAHRQTTSPGDRGSAPSSPGAGGKPGKAPRGKTQRPATKRKTPGT
ncbi:TetR family transcriptional regulator [Burkholderia sp. SG-MS1]|uniref:TetR/AcrR family transcriptional regulator n=1 Tax=Paraburkholderia sp. SG-MS1 TaxID=2023741 RepID=UPI0014458CE5|nr:TetR/AcrR family transcriptional regulator [Paraburkholderia sp. SG-MS1]NKJ45275.1 TetR family transcriptional regulator [Paraburkholderia sp. SG-MS1]